MTKSESQTTTQFPDVFRQRPLSCPEGLPRDLLQFSIGMAISSIDTESQQIPSLETIVPFRAFFFDERSPFRCHNCPLPTDQGCSTNIKQFSKNEPTSTIFDHLILTQTPLKERPIASRLGPITKNKLQEMGIKQDRINEYKLEMKIHYYTITHKS